MTDILGRLTTSLADRYQIERELGQGGMAVVYLARDLRHDRKVALKVLRAELAAILGGDRFLQEIRTTANLQHPHILPLHDSGSADGIVYYVMPYIEGESLRDRIVREKQLPVDDAVRIAREVASALDYAHRNGIVHRDIKPENILLHDGQAVVADFGIALAASRSDGSTRMTETGMSLGTPHYMAPEQAMGDREITPKADIYALGCVLYEMLAGEPPFGGPTAQAIIARVMTEQPRSLTLQRHTIPAELEETVRMALEKLPADRFASAAQFADALSGKAMPVTRATAARPARPARTARAMVLAAMPWLLLLFASGFGAWSWWRPEPPARVIRQRIILRDLPFGAGQFGRNVAISPDGRTVVYIDTAGGGTRNIWAKEADRLDPTLLAGTVDAWGPHFSPDGEWIAFVADGKLKKVPRLGGSAITLADSANPTYHAIAWLDNDSVAYNDARFNLRLVHADGGPSREIFSVDSVGRGAISTTALPGGRGVLAGTCFPGCTNVDLRVLDLRTGVWSLLSDEVIKGWHTRDGDVVFVRQDGGVFRAPFDLERLAFRSAPAPVMDGVRTVPGRADFVLGADGTLLYIAGAASQSGIPSEWVYVSRDGIATPVETGWSFLPAGNFGMALSPDGRRLALSIRGSGSDDIWIKELDRGPLTRLSFGGVNTRPEWTADGRRVMHTSRGATGAREEVVSRSADGTGATDTLVRASRGVFDIRRTRDTTRLIVRVTTPPSRDIMLARIGGDSGSVEPLVANHGFDEIAPALSPDGRWLAYASNESGRFEIYVRPFPAVNDGRWQVSSEGGVEPRWAHSGRELFYRAGGNLVAVAVGAGATFTAGEHRTLFPVATFTPGIQTPNYAVLPGDRRFLFMRSLAAAGPTVPTFTVRVDNWLAELAESRRAR